MALVAIFEFYYSFQKRPLMSSFDVIVTLDPIKFAEKETTMSSH